MKARYEQRKRITTSKVSVTDYLNLANLPHWHTEYELVFIISGNAEIMINNTLFNVSKDNIIFISSEDIHYIRSDKDSIIRVLKIDRELLKPVAEKYTLSSPVMENSYSFFSISTEIKQELEQKQQNYSIIADCTALKLTAEIFRGEKASKHSAPSNSSNEKFKELLRLISERYSYLTFEEAADFMCLSQPYFSKYFHRMSGMTFTQYINIVKVSAASDLISEKKMSFTEIAAICGFGTIRSFNRVFKELTGISPTQFALDPVLIRTERSDSGFDPTLSCSVQLSGADIASLPDFTE